MHFILPFCFPALTYMYMTKTNCLLSALLLSSALTAGAETYKGTEFLNPDMQWRPVPLWFWNNTSVNADDLTLQLERMVTIDGYGGCAILPFGTGFRPGYLTDDYFTLYGKAIDKARSLGASMSIYDEYGFPSGSMGAINGSGVTTFKNNHPGHTVKRLDKQETNVPAGTTFSRTLNSSGTLMSAVAWNTADNSIISLRDRIDGNNLSWQAPSDGNWRVMLFYCVEDGDPNVDYLSPESVSLFVQDTHQAYYDRFGDNFGATVKSTFFDEPTMYRANGRMWTNDFNDKFRAEYGMDPDVFYPALWYNIGENTAAARNMMFGLRAKLYSEGFMKTIGDWADAHGIIATGHQDQEEVLNPVSVAGDLMLVGKHIGMPGIDKIGGDRPAEHFYKVVSSSANNWDKTYVMSETYGDMGNISMETMYNIATEQYTKGINHLIPHAVWYDSNNVTFLPELSWRNPLYNYGLPDFNKFLSRLNYMLARPGRHVADVAVLYPITTMQTGHYLDGPKGYMQGGVDIPGTDYNVVSRILTDELGVDFTYLHPSVLDDRCEVAGGRLVMNNEINSESFSVIILPGVKALTKSNIEKIVKAWEAGCTVIFTTQRPSVCADYGCDDAIVADAVERMIAGQDGCGKVVFVGSPSASTIGNALQNEDLDVRFQTSAQPFNYIHKVVDGKDVYYFGNIDSAASECVITLRGEKEGYSILYPRSGKVADADLSAEGGHTSLTLSLSPGESAFLVDSSLIDLSDMPDEIVKPGYSIDLDFKIEKVSAGVCFAARDTRNYYMWQINVEDKNNPRIRPHRWFDGGVSLLGEVSMAGKVDLNNDDMHHLRIVVENGTHAVTYVDDVLVDERDGQFPMGMIGFRETHSDASNSIEAAYFDNVKVTQRPDGTLLMDEDFSASNPFSSGTLQNGMLYVAGTMTFDNYAWGVPQKDTHFSVEADITLVKDDIAVVFAEQAPDTYYMWAVNCFDGAIPRIRHHIFTYGQLSWNDSEFNQFSKAQILGTERHVKIEVDGAYIKTFIDDVLVDTYMDWSDNLKPGLVGFRIDTQAEQRDDAYIDNVCVKEYDADGNPMQTLFDDFEPGSPRWFRGVIIEEVDGNHKMHIHGDRVLLKWMQLTEPDQPDTSAVSGVYNSAADVEYFNLQGIKVNNPASGIYIVRRPTGVSKEIIRK